MLQVRSQWFIQRKCYCWSTWFILSSCNYTVCWFILYGWYWSLQLIHLFSMLQM